MIVQLVLAALLSPCLNASSLAEGAPAPCDGILWGVQQSKAALDCARVDLPVCRSDLALQSAALASKLAEPPEPVQPSGFGVPAIFGAFAGGLALGIVAGVLVVL